MNPFTHLFVSWTAGDQAGLPLRDLKIVSLAGVSADLDGLSVIPDLINRLLGRPETDYYFRYHHSLTHGLPAALLATVIGFVWATRRWKTAGMVLLVYHLHLLCDLIGSRGPTRADLWGLSYLAPISNRLDLVWAGQWPLNSWPNIALTLVLMAVIIVRAVQRGYSPVCLLSARADYAFVKTVRNRFGTNRKSSAI